MLCLSVFFLSYCARFDAAGSILGYVLLSQGCYTATEAPSGIIVTTQTAPAQIGASWNASATCAAGSRVVRKTGSLPSDKDDGTVIASTTTAFTDTSVAGGTLYYYRVYFYNSAGVYSSGTAIAARTDLTSVNPPKVVNDSITVDGLDSDAAWTSCPQFNFSFSEVYGESGGNDSPSGYMKLAYDDNYFYVFYKSNDKYVHYDAAIGQPWIDDSVEIFFDMNFDRAALPQTDDYQIIFSSNTADWFHGKGTGAVYNTVWTPAATQVVVVSGTLNNEADVDTGWSTEIRIPLSDLGLTISSGKTIGFTFSPNEDDTLGHGAQHAYKWTTGSVYNQPSTWGIAQF